MRRGFGEGGAGFGRSTRDFGSAARDLGRVSDEGKAATTTESYFTGVRGQREMLPCHQSAPPPSQPIRGSEGMSHGLCFLSTIHEKEKTRFAVSF